MIQTFFLTDYVRFTFRKVGKKDGKMEEKERVRNHEEYPMQDYQNHSCGSRICYGSGGPHTYTHTPLSLSSGLIVILPSLLKLTCLPPHTHRARVMIAEPDGSPVTRETERLSRDLEMGHQVPNGENGRKKVENLNFSGSSPTDINT